MKKVLIGLAAAAMAVVGTGAGSASAGWAGAGETVFENILDLQSDGKAAELEDLFRDAGIDDLLDTCGKPLYTVFVPPMLYSALSAVADLLGYSSIEKAFDLAPDTVKGILALHVVATSYDDGVLNADNGLTTLKNLAGLSLDITKDTDGDESYENFAIEGIDVVDSQPACNGYVHELDQDLMGADKVLGIFLPPSEAGDPSCGVTFGSCAPTGTTTPTGTGLPKTGSESMALTYAALASLIAGAGVLVIRRRSVA